MRFTIRDAEPSDPRCERPVAHRPWDDRPARAGIPRDRGGDPRRGPRDRGPAPDQRRQGSGRVPVRIQGRTARGEGVSSVSHVPPWRPSDQGGHDVLARRSGIRDDATGLEGWRLGAHASAAGGEPAVDALSGEPDEPAPRLHDVRLDAPAEFMEAVLTGVDKLAAAGIVHSDLSAFNVLVHPGVPFFIDFSDALPVDRTGSVPWIPLTQAPDTLVHGFQALGKHFHRYGLAIEADTRADRIVQSLDRFGVLSNRTR